MHHYTIFHLPENMLIMYCNALWDTTIANSLSKDSQRVTGWIPAEYKRKDSSAAVIRWEGWNLESYKHLKIHIGSCFVISSQYWVDLFPLNTKQTKQKSYIWFVHL